MAFQRTPRLAPAAARLGAAPRLGTTGSPSSGASGMAVVGNRMTFPVAALFP